MKIFSKHGKPIVNKISFQSCTFSFVFAFNSSNFLMVLFTNKIGCPFVCKTTRNMFSSCKRNSNVEHMFLIRFRKHIIRPDFHVLGQLAL